MSRVVDLSHSINAGMITFPGLPGPVISVYSSREETAARMAGGVSFEIARIDMVANTGTYVDAPSHYHAGGPDLAGLSLDRLVDVPAEVIRAVGRRAIGPDLLRERSLAGKAVLVHTGGDRHWGTPSYAQDSPYLTKAAVEHLVAAGVAMVGIDSVNVDALDDLTRPAHAGLLRAGIPICEHLTGLEHLPDTGLRFTALPAPVVGMGTFPVRAVAVIDEA